MSELYDNQNLKLNGTYIITDKGELSDGTNVYEIPFTGTIPTGGYLTYENNILKDGCITMEEYKVNIEDGEITIVEKGSCGILSLTACDSLKFNPSLESWFNFDSTTGTITGFSDAWDGTTDITIPCQINGVDVINIGSGAFAGKNLTSVILNENIVEIMAGAFYTNDLTDIIVPSKVETIGDSAFYGNQLMKLTLANSVETIGRNAFGANQLTEIIIPNSVKTIGEAAFQNNQLTELVIPDSVTDINFQSLFPGNNIMSLKIGHGITSIPEKAFYGDEYNLVYVEIPGSVKTISSNAFASNQITELIIEAGVETIEYGAFALNPITKLVIPDSVTTIGQAAFYYNKLTDIVIPDSVTTIGQAAFYGNQINSLKIGNNVETIGENAFGNNQLSEVIIPNKVVSIGNNAFHKGKLINSEGVVLIENQNLTTIYNNTRKEFDWGYIINGSSGYNFETGIVENQYGNVEIKKSN